ncbi:MAG: carbohydrate ABC transporter permease [Halanaerobiales bacterium]
MAKKISLYLFLSILAIVFFMPFFIILTTSFKTLKETTMSGFTILPSGFQYENFIKAFQGGNWLRYYFNSFIVTFITVLGSLIINSLAGYVLARLNIKGRNIMLMFFLLGIMMPFQTYIIPQFIILKHIPFASGNNILGQGGMGWINTYMGLIIPFLTGSFGIFLCRQFYMTFPKALDEAAKIDGCNPLTTYLKIYLPLSTPILATLLILKSVSVWNNFFYPLIITNTKDMYTVQLGLQRFMGYSQIEWPVLMAATLISILPVVMVFLFAQKYYIQGMANTGIKG